MSYRLLDQFRSLFEGKKYLHRNSGLGDSVARCLPEDLYDLAKSKKLNDRIDNKLRVLNIENQLRGVKARRGDGTFGEIVPHAQALTVIEFHVARGPIATVEIGLEVKILAKAMIKQIDRVMTDLLNQRQQFENAGGDPIAVGIVGINHAEKYVSYEGAVAWPTGQKGHKHPIVEAKEAERRLLERVKPSFDEFLVLRFKAENVDPFDFEWMDEQRTIMDYGAALTRILRKYDARF